MMGVRRSYGERPQPQWGRGVVTEVGICMQALVVPAGEGPQGTGQSDRAPVRERAGSL